MGQKVDAKKIIDKFSANIINPYNINIVRGDGSYVYDINSKKYIDMATGISSTNFGHQNPEIFEALIEQSQKVSIVSRLFYNEPLSMFLKKACELTNMDKAIVMNSGAEAIETAIKVIRKWAYIKKQIPQDRAQIITFDNSFHGRTIAAISSSSEAKYKANFGPLTPGFKSIPFNNIEALKAAINDNTAAIIIEPIQGEAGVIIPDPNYLSSVGYKALCLLEQQSLALKSEVLSDFFISELKKIDSKYIKEIRAKGLFIALQIYAEYFENFYKTLIDSGLLAVKTRNNSIRLLPPLTINQETLKEATEIIKKIEIH
ncbi:UNVERIFIED_CONTAM: hypothetical protein GTU68_030103 [Idotea baltica]|nr:hypothetical protein [Idotea baltica]